MGISRFPKIGLPPVLIQVIRSVLKIETPMVTWDVEWVSTIETCQNWGNMGNQNMGINRGFRLV